jgi:hypothetical protein
MNAKLIAAIAASVLVAGCAAPGYLPYGYSNGGQPQYAGYPQYQAPVQPAAQYGSGYPQYPAPVQQAAQYGGYPQYAGAAAPAAAPCPEVNAGHIIGGIAGALLGAQVGNGNGRTAAAAVGAVTGALAGGSVGRDPNCR